MTLQNFFSGLIQIELSCLWDMWNWVVYWFYAKSGINVKFYVLVKYLWNWVVYWFYAKSGINVKFCVLVKYLWNEYLKCIIKYYVLKNLCI